MSNIAHWGEGRDEFPERDMRYHCKVCGNVKALGRGEVCGDCRRAPEQLRGAVDRIAELEQQLRDEQAREQGVPTAADYAEMDRLERREEAQVTYVSECDRLRAAVRELLAAHAEYRDTDSLLTALSREFPELRPGEAIMREVP